MNRREFARLCASAAATEAIAAKGIPAAQTADDHRQNDAYVRRQGATWTVGTSMCEQTVALKEGRLLLTSFRNRVSGQDYHNGPSALSEIRATIDGVSTASPAWRWTLVGDNVERLNGALYLTIRLRSGAIEAESHWVLYPQSAIVRRRLTIQNISSAPVRVQDLHFLNTQTFSRTEGALELDYITGGGNFNGSQLLKTEPIGGAYRRLFDSNSGVQTGSYSAYLPLILVRGLRSKDTWGMGWDYLGHWSIEAARQDGGPVSVGAKVAGYDAELQPGQRVESPKAFTAAFSGGIDEIGNQILDWQYRHLWDLTNARYFAKTRWAVDWPTPWIGNGGTPSGDNWGRRLALDLRYTDLLRETGGDILWDDAGWYDAWGSWNSPGWRLTTEYLAKHDMRWVLWFPTFLATPESVVGQQHPGWIPQRDLFFDQSIADTASWQNVLLDRSVASWGDFQERYDIAPASAPTDTRLLAADQNFRGMLKRFKTSHPGSGIDACDGGGRWISYDLAAMAESGECTDGGVGPYTAYYSSLIVPPDKLHNVSDFDHTYYNPSSDRIHLALDPTWYRDPGDGPDIDCIRKDWEIYRFMVARGAAGRWSHIFRPQATGDDCIWYFQRMDRTGLRGVILTKHAKTGDSYFVISRPLRNFSGDSYEGGPAQMPRILTSDAVRADTGIYEDPIDGERRFYGVPGEFFGPVDFRYRDGSGERSFVTKIQKRGGGFPVKSAFFGMAFQAGSKPIEITELGQHAPDQNRGVYELTLVRASDSQTLGSTTLDMSGATADAKGFKYAKLERPVEIEAGLDRPIVIFPRGLEETTAYDVRACCSKLRQHRSGGDLMKNGITLAEVPPGEIIFLNLPDYPGAGELKSHPLPPSGVTKRVGTNLGAQGIEVSWMPPANSGWISYYEVLKNGAVLGRTANGQFFFDHSPGAARDSKANYEVRTVDSAGNRSPAASASEIAGEPEMHQPLGEFSPEQAGGGWKYEESFDGFKYRELTWQCGGYEGFWAGSGLGRIGRIWMQPAAGAELARTFIAPRAAAVTISGEIQKDPSADKGFPLEARIEHNGGQLWPSSGWAAVPEFGAPLRHRADVSVEEGEAIRFVVRRIGADRAEPILWNPILVLRDRG